MYFEQRGRLRGYRNIGRGSQNEGEVKTNRLYKSRGKVIYLFYLLLLCRPQGMLLLCTCGVVAARGALECCCVLVALGHGSMAYILVPALSP